MGGAKRPGVRDWLSAARHPGRRDGVIAVALLVLPWAVALALAPLHHHLDSGAVGILATVSLGLPALWLAWVGYQVASRPLPAGGGAGPVVTVGSRSVVADRGGTAIGPVVADRGGTAIGQVVYQQRRGVTGKPVRLADPPPLLAGREKLLAELDTRLTGGDGSRPRTVVLCGLGGVGKTSVAVAYAHRHLAEVGSAWQFAAEDPTVLADGFAELAAQLGERDLGDMRDPVVSVHGTLAAFPERWLLIFDNVDDRASVQGFLPPAGPGRVLITSQNPNWPRRQALDVPELETGVAADFLGSRTSDPDSQAATELAAELGGLPLALEQAAAYMQAAGESLAGYLALFLRRRPDLLDRGQPTGYPGTVATTWALAFARLERSAPGAAGLLRLLAFYAPEAVPLRLLLQPRPGFIKELRRNVAKVQLKRGREDRLTVRDAVTMRRRLRKVAKVLKPLLEDEVTARDAVTALGRYSLVRPVGDAAVSVHRLVQAVTADQMPAGLALTWQQAAAALVEAALPEDPQQPDTWPDYAALLPHARAVFDLTSGGMRPFVNYLGYSGSYPAARDLAQLIADAYKEDEAYGPEHPATLAAEHDLARWIGEAGDRAGARDQHAALLTIFERMRGPEHPETLAIRATLARWTGEAGDPAGARDQLAALLSIEERALGAEDPNTLTVRHNLAYNTGAAGDAAGARDQFAALLPVRDRVLGPEHPDTLVTRGNLALWTGQAGDAAGARDQLAALLRIDERVLGGEHPETLGIRTAVAYWTGQMGDAAGARDQYAALLPIVKRVLGPEHPETLSIRTALARWTGAAGDPAGARDQYAALLSIEERVLGAEHPNTLTVRHNLAYSSGEAGDPAGARDQYVALLPIRERVLGAQHPATVASRGELAYWTKQAEDAAGTL